MVPIGDAQVGRSHGGRDKRVWVTETSETMEVKNELVEAVAVRGGEREKGK